jgi:tetratricopeptide (TPR) repeat protein
MFESDTNLDDSIHTVEEQIKELYNASRTSLGNSALELDLKEKIQRVITDVPSVEHGDKNQKAKVYYLCGKAWEILPQYSKEAEEYLSKAVKLSPVMMDAWNSLGHCFWKKNDLLSAHNCYSTALQLSPNKVSYRELSRILRLIDVSKQLSSETNAEKLKSQKAENVEQSLEMAKKAITMDMEDGESWCMFVFCFNTVRFPRTRVLELLHDQVTRSRRHEQSIKSVPTSREE